MDLCNCLETFARATRGALVRLSCGIDHNAVLSSRPDCLSGAHLGGYVVSAGVTATAVLHRPSDLADAGSVTAGVLLAAERTL